MMGLIIMKELLKKRTLIYAWFWLGSLTGSNFLSYMPHPYKRAML